MEKRKIDELIIDECKSYYRYDSNAYTWGEIKKILREKKVELQDDDSVIISFVEEESGSDWVSPPHYEFRVSRTRMETDEEFEKRKKEIQFHKEESERREYKEYVRLKEKFETPNGK
jgi:hypothetical protein